MELPSTFDVIVVGTGMPECIVAAAAARAGKTVLHLDRNGYYGGDWTSFNFDQLLTWIGENQVPVPNDPPANRIIEASWIEALDDSEHLIPCAKYFPTVANITQKIYIKEKNLVAIPEQESAPPIATQASGDTSVESQQKEIQDSEEVNALSIEDDAQPDLSDACQPEPNATSGNDVGPLTSNVSIPLVQVVGFGEGATSAQENEASGSGEVPIIGSSQPENNAPDQTSNRPVSTQVVSSSSTDSAQTSTPRQTEWTLESLKENRRKFNIDLSPKLLFARGSLVELLISSNIARYAEFQCVNRVLTHINGHLEQVPCSRADVFSTKSVSVVEKRMLMKLLTFCMEYQNHPKEYKGFEGRPFLEFLRSKKVTPNIEHYVLHAIAMVDESCPTLQGLEATRKFMEALGRYGNSPFLWTCYGSGELPQCFCRLCAVFGGIYYLQRDVDAVILDSDNKCTGVISLGNKITCQSLVMEYSYAPLQYLPEQQPEMISRAIYITNSSILPAERQQNTLLRLPPVPAIRNAITVLEFGSLSFTCPDNLYVVHMVCKSFGSSVNEDFKSAENELFQPLDQGEIGGSSKPKVLWCAYFKQPDMTMLDLSSRVPPGILLTSSPGGEQDYEHSVKEAQKIFEKICPGEEFLPRAPDPEDIVMEESSNPGTHDDPATSGEDRENDVDFAEEAYPDEVGEIKTEGESGEEIKHENEDVPSQEVSISSPQVISSPNETIIGSSDGEKTEGECESSIVR